MHSLLKEYFGYSEFRPLQEEVISNVLAGNDSFVLMPTGGGKSLCYQIPALKLPGVTLVVSPLISLMKDQVDVLKGNGVTAEFLNSSLSAAEISGIQTRLQNGEIKILYIAPERLALSAFQDFLKSLTISLIAIDEAHCISEWGHDFRPDYRVLQRLKEWFPGIPLIALTATATPEVQVDILKQLKMEDAQVFLSSFHRANLHLTVLQKKNAFEKLLTLLRKYEGESAIVYCFSRKETESLCADLAFEGLKALPYHAGLDSEKRKLHQELFIRDEVPIIVATIAFGMGIDKPDVRLVVHYTYPKSLEGYYQEIGRAGRDSLPSECVLFFSHADTMKHEFFLKEIADPEEQARTKQKLQSVIDYAETNRCRTQYLLRYFGEEMEKPCGHCDRCLQPSEEFDATEIAQKILSCIIRTGNRFGMVHIANILTGKKTPQIVRNGHEALSVFGIVQNFSMDELKRIIHSLLEAGLLQKSTGEYPTLAVTERGTAFLKNRESISLPKPSREEEAGEIRSREALPYHPELFAELRTLRKRLADEGEVPPFVIFSDLSLQEMATYFPVDRLHFSQISGVGQQKLERFGEVFLELISQFLSSHSDCKPQEIPTRSRERLRTINRNVRRPGSNYQKTKEMIEKRLSLAEMARAHGFTPNTIVTHIEKILATGEELDIAYLKPSDELFLPVSQAFVQSGQIERLAPVFELLKEEYGYDELRLVRLFLSTEAQ